MHKLFAGLSVDDYLGIWFATDSEGSTSSMQICFRIAEGKIGMKDFQLMDNKGVDSQYMVNGNSIKGISGAWKNYVGQYQIDAGFISWSRSWSETEGYVSIWSRPGNSFRS